MIYDKDYDKLKCFLFHLQFMEYKTKYQESMRDLQNQLRQAQNVSKTFQYIFKDSICKLGLGFKCLSVKGKYMDTCRTG